MLHVWPYLGYVVYCILVCSTFSDKLMASNTSFNNCSPCTLRHLTKPSTVFCIVCDEALCSDCKEHHKLLKILRDHQLIHIEDYLLLPPFVRNINQYCEKHGEILEFFCQSHDVVCCKRCATTIHGKCTDNVKMLQDLIGEADSYPTFDDINKTLSELDNNTKAAIADRKSNMESLSEQKQTILRNISLQRQLLNEHLDKIEALAKDELETCTNRASTKIGNTLKTFQEKELKLAELKNSVHWVRNINSSPYNFICKRELGSSIQKLENEIKNVYELVDLKHTSLDCKFNELITNFEKNIKTFGEIVTKIEHSPRLSLQMTVILGAQITAFQTIDIRNMKLSLKDTIKLGSVNEIIGCTSLKDGSVLFTDILDSHKGQMIKVQNGNKYKARLGNKSVFDVVNLDENLVAVTTGILGCSIEIYEVYKLKFVRSISTETWCYGATTHDQSVMFCSGRSKLEVVNTQTGTVSPITSQIGECFEDWNTHLTSDKTYTYLSDFRSNTITCFDHNGTKQWKFTKPKELKQPRGITIDSNSNLYVAGYQSNNVIILSSDGQLHKEILTSQDGLDRPKAIHFDKLRNQLVVCNTKGLAFIFQLS